MSMIGAGVPTVLGGRYLLGGELGQGGMAVVLRARDTVLHRDVAVKILDSLLVDEPARERFQIEGETLAGLHHPGLVMVFDAGVESGRPYLVMELVDGETLAERCRSRPLGPAEVLEIGVQLAAALDHVHRRGIAHRDVKPGNVLLGADGRVRLADFGIARALDSTSTLTAPGTAVGTPAYLAPEQVRGETGSTPIDVYALGLVLLEALRGRPTYTGAPHVAAYARLMEPPSMDGIPIGLRELLGRMTDTQPSARPSARQVGARLTSLLDGADTMAITAELPIEAASRRRRVTVRRLAGVAVGAVLLGGSLIAFTKLSGDGSQAPRVADSPAHVGTAAPPATADPAGRSNDRDIAPVPAIGKKAHATSSSDSGATKTIKTKDGKGKAKGHARSDK